MNHEELLKLVRDTSIDLMNKGKGDGTVYACYSDEQIVAEFGGKTEAQVIRRVAKMDKATASVFNEVRMFSGEYKMVNGVSVSIYELERQAEARAEALAEVEARAEAKEEADLISVSLELGVTLSILVMKNEAGTPAGDLARATSVFVHNTLAEQRRLLAKLAEQGESYAEYQDNLF